MAVKRHILFFIFNFLLLVGYGQDAALTATIGPNSGCNLTNSEVVGVVILNNSSTTFIPPNTIEMFYTIDGGSQQQQMLGASLSGGATWNFNFSAPGDFSTCGPHEVKVWLDYPSDTDNTNDTIVWTVQNDCTVQPGTILSDMTVCELGNEDTLRLDNWQYGSIIDWEYSDNNGTSWNSLGGVTDTFYIFQNLVLETQYRVIIDGGFCPNDTAGITTVSIQPAPTSGTVTGANSVCAANSSGTLQVSGASGSVIQWEFTIDGGNDWDTIPNTTTSENYNNLTQTTWYRVLTDGGVCPDVYSDTAVIFVETTTIGGTLAMDTVICPEEAVELFLDGKLGAITHWESSNDGNTWNTINHTDTNYNTGPLTSNTYFRVIVQNGICPEDTSNNVLVEIYAPGVADAGADQTITEGDTIQLAGIGGVMGIWYPGGTLSDSTIYNPDAFPTTTTTYTLTTISGEGCVASDQVVITVEPAPEPPPEIPPFDIKNTITANEDGFNDSWIIEGLEAYPDTYVAVYNIYGKELYTSDDYNNEWSGTYNGKTLPNGTYMYVVKPGGTDNTYKGNLTILGNE